jgi:hypothetical protein
VADIWCEIEEALESVRAAESGASVFIPYEVKPDARNEAAFFFKPELTSDSNVDLQAVTELVRRTFEKHDAEIVAGVAMSGPFLSSHNIIADHYGTINNVSREGIDGLAPPARSRLQEVFADMIAQGAEIWGGHQFLNRFPFFTSEALAVLWQAKDAISVKLSPGAYAIDYRVLDRKVVLLNGFHPHQLTYYTARGKAIIVLIIRSSTAWRVLRNGLIGATDPNEAAPGSIRRQLLENQNAFHIQEISKGLNGAHLSAGPVEGFFEIQRFFESVANVEGHANFLHAYSGAGLDEGKLAALAANPLLGPVTNHRPLFDATEDMEMSDAISFLKNCVG